MRHALTLSCFILLLTTVVPASYGRDAAFSFEKHWSFPLQLQGKAPAGFSKVEASLDPDDCGTCHEKQFEEWKNTRHSMAMGPGVTGQLHSPWLDRESVIFCTNCHAPLAEQSLDVSALGGQPKDFIPKLRQRGITCAACHIRKNIRYGPTPRSERIAEPPHGGFVEVKDFGSSLFCKACHQFEEGGNRVNGKLLQNTYIEWQQSGYPAKGIQCSTCHMPDRRHTWLGIHSQDMVRRGVTISVERKKNVLFFVIVNSGVGHNFPTYATSKVVIRGAVLDNNGNELPETVMEEFIGWDIALDLSEEYYDTRIPPGGEFRAMFKMGSSNKGKKYRIILRVYPDDFYGAFYKALIDDPPDGVDIKKIKAAYIESQKSAYTLFEKTWDISDPNFDGESAR